VSHNTIWNAQSVSQCACQ